ncbi:MAG: SH3 domain-containing protein [Chloroflexi bacterium]|nr:SH3 domain-containing protein [Chloroflexota bacterium]
MLANELNLRAGPGTDYARIGLLHQGDILEILGRVDSNKWIQVAMVMTTSTLGWMAAGSQDVTINGDLNSLPILTPPPPPPTPTPTLSPTPSVPLVTSPPILLAPQPNASQFKGRIDLEWDWPGTLGPNEYFQVEIRNRYNAASSIIDETVSPIDVAWVKDKFYRYDTINQAYDREYAWRIIVVRYKSTEPLREKDWAQPFPEIQIWEPPSTDKVEQISNPSEMRALYVEFGPGPP